MASLGSQAIKDSYEQILHVNRSGGGNTSTQVDCYDGDSATKFCFKFNDYETDQSLFTVYGEHANGTELRIDTSGAGDATLAFQISANTKAMIGVDNTDSDKFFLGSNTGTSTQTLAADLTNFRVGIGQSPSLTHTLTVANTEAQSVLNLVQSNDDEPFVRFTGTTASDDSKSISTDTTVDETDKYGAIRISINGTDKWIRVYDTHS